jgi:hypothetical protein
MSTFVVRFLGDPLKSFCGRVRHVASSEEMNFSDVTELIAFFEGINAMEAMDQEEQELKGVRTRSLTPPED